MSSSTNMSSQASSQFSLHTSEIDSINFSIEVLREEMFDNFETTDSPDYTHKEHVYRCKEQQIQRFQEKIISLLRGSNIDQEVDIKFFSDELIDLEKEQGILAWVHTVSVATSTSIKMAGATLIQLRDLQKHLDDALDYKKHVLERRHDLLSGVSFEELLDMNDKCIEVEERITAIELDIKEHEMKIERYFQITTANNSSSDN